MPVCRVALSAMDLMRTVHWYRRTFDWQPVGERGEQGGDIWAQVPGLPEAHFTVWRLVEQPRFFQFEIFEFSKPRMKPQRADALASDLGYSSIGLYVPQFDLVLDRITCTGGCLLTDPQGPQGERRVCLRDPEGVLLELMEDIRPPASPGHGDVTGVLASVNSIRLSVPDLGRAVRFWVDGLGLSEAHGVTLHTQEHETLWGLAGAERKSVLLNGGNILVELVQYWRPRGRSKPAGALLSDQGILNVALGTTDRSVFNDVFARAERAGFPPCHAPWTLPGFATVVYIPDGQGVTGELIAVEPTARALHRMGFAHGPDA